MAHFTEDIYGDKNYYYTLFKIAGIIGFISMMGLSALLFVLVTYYEY